MLWDLYGGSHKRRWVAWILGLTYIPTVIGLDVGQIAPFVLLGLAGFLLYQYQRMWVLTGFFAFLISIKPQLLYLFWPLLLLWIINKKRWVVLWTLLISGLIATAIPVLFNQSILFQYVSEYLNNSPLNRWEPPVISFALRPIFGMDKHWLQFIPSIIGYFIIIIYWHLKKGNWRWESHIHFALLLSVITTSYGWTFDLIVLLPTIIFATIQFMNEPKRNISLLFLYILINAIMLSMLIIGTPEFYGIWIPYAWLIFSLLLYKLISNNNGCAEINAA